MLPHPCPLVFVLSHDTIPVFVCRAAEDAEKAGSGSFLPVRLLFSAIQFSLK